ncbi:MAG: RyR domain-containing protein, partial [Candidatus Thorarchaeota archaeon]
TKKISEFSPIERKVKCYVHIINNDLKNLLKKHIIFTNQFDIFDLIFFNTYENTARLLFRYYPVDELAVINPTLEPVHIVIIGLGQTGQNVLLQAIKICHYTARISLSITVIDENAKNIVKTILHEYPNIPNLVNFNYEEIDVLTSDLIEARFWQIKPPITLFIVSLNSDVSSLTVALSLLAKSKSKRIPVLVRMRENTGLAALLEEPDFTKENPIYPFGMMKKIISRDIIINESMDSLAIALNNEYLKDRISKGENKKTNPSLAMWSSLSEELKESNRQEADHIDVKLRCIDCHVKKVVGRDIKIFEYSEEEIEELSHLEHKRWQTERLLNGWKYGEIRDSDKKTNPNLISWEQLPEHVKEYNRETVRKIPIILAKYNLEIQRNISSTN